MNTDKKRVGFWFLSYPCSSVFIRGSTVLFLPGQRNPRPHGGLASRIERELGNGKREIDRCGTARLARQERIAPAAHARPDPRDCLRRLPGAGCGGRQSEGSRADPAQQDRPQHHLRCELSDRRQHARDGRRLAVRSGEGHPAARGSEAHRPDQAPAGLGARADAGRGEGREAAGRLARAGHARNRDRVSSGRHPRALHGGCDRADDGPEHPRGRHRPAGHGEAGERARERDRARRGDAYRRGREAGRGRPEAAATPEAGATAAEPEVIKKGKKEEEGAAPDAKGGKKEPEAKGKKK